MIDNDELQSLRESARHAEADTRYAQAAEYYELIHQHSPATSDGYLGQFRTLRQLGREAEAEAALAKGLTFLPEDADLLASYAWAAHQRRDWEEVLRRWEAYRLKFPHEAAVYAHLGIAFVELKLFDEADGMLLDGLAIHPDEAELLGNYAWVAHRRQDWPEALRRWRGFLEKFRACPEVCV